MSAAACPLCGDEKHDSWCGANYEDSAGDCNCVGTERRKAAPAFTVPMDAPLVSYRQGFNDGEKYAELKAHEKANHSRKVAAPPACKNCGKPGQHFAESCPFCLESITDGHWHIVNGWRCVFSMTAPPAVCAVCGGPPDNGTVGHHHPRPAPPAVEFCQTCFHERHRNVPCWLAACACAEPPIDFTREELEKSGQLRLELAEAAGKGE